MHSEILLTCIKPKSVLKTIFFCLFKSGCFRQALLYLVQTIYDLIESIDFYEDFNKVFELKYFNRYDIRPSRFEQA